MKILATDYDGTVTHEGLTPAFRTALANWKAAGNLFVIVTGRPVFSITDTCFLNNLNPDYIVADNGAVVCDSQNKPVFEKRLDLVASVKVIKHISHYKTSYFRVGNSICYCNSPFAPEEVSADIENGTLDFGYFRMKNPTELCVRFETEEITKQLHREIIEVSDGILHGLSSSSTAIDIVDININKATGIKYLIQSMNLHPEKIYTTGDAGNDLAMLTDPEFEGYCVENAKSDLKEKVGRIIKSPRELMEKFL